MYNQQNWLQYYKNSLFDSENLAVDLGRIQNIYHQKNDALNAGTIVAKNAAEILDTEERRINRIKGITKKSNSNYIELTEIEILIAPFYLTYKQPTDFNKGKKIHPFWIPARVNRSGQLSCPKDLFPLVARNYLTPISGLKDEFIFSSIENIISAREREKPVPIDGEEKVSWADYWNYVNEMFEHITYQSLYDYNVEGYNSMYELTYFATSAKIATGKSILFLYENILKEFEELPLLSKIITPRERQRQRKEAVTDQQLLIHNHLHLGQMSDKFPLSISQRKTLLSYLSSDHHSVTAVNGPPGTGKTTLLQSVVATEFVKSALIGEEAPVILACSTNNQAVTNIIDSFINSESSLGVLSDRWIPNFTGHATYLPSNSKSEKVLKDINYLKGNLFGYEGTLCELENETYLHEAIHYYFDKFYEAYQIEFESLEDVLGFLQSEIQKIEAILTEGSQTGNNFVKSIAFVNSFLRNPDDYLQKETLQIGELKEWRKILTSIKAQHKSPDFIDEVKKYFTTEEENNPAYSFVCNSEVLAENSTALKFINDCLKHVNLAVQSNLKLRQWRSENNIQGYPFASEEQMWEYEYEKMNSGDTTHRFFYDEIDVTLRHKAFLLATHYWEARWLIATHEMLESDTEKGTGEKVMMAKWKRRAMLTPCFVATFYMGPQHFIYSQFQGQNEEGRAMFEYLPLFNFLDVLIIDEAGQVTPEISVPLFSLAKKAIIVGDLKQIEPIWSIPKQIDQGNLVSESIIKHYEQSDYLCDLGFLASTGTIMKMAQNACEFETPLPHGKQPGLLLVEHRRCNDEIIGFCNELAYNGILKPMKGKAKDDQIFPSMVAYHIEGRSERKHSSRYNKDEVKAILKWLAINRDRIEEAYNIGSVEEILGIITPFASQKNELTKALVDAGYKIGDIKLGTVHALQGAEREIVLFSSVYSHTDEGTLFFDVDNKPNMLNVAVSRAKDSFILFGDTRVFDENNDTPSGVLKKHLNVIDFN